MHFERSAGRTPAEWRHLLWLSVLRHLRHQRTCDRIRQDLLPVAEDLPVGGVRGEAGFTDDGGAGGVGGELPTSVVGAVGGGVAGFHTAGGEKREGGGELAG